MARDLEVIRRYCSVSDEEARALASPAAPIVLLKADGPARLPEQHRAGPEYPRLHAANDAAARLAAAAHETSRCHDVGQHLQCAASHFRYATQESNSHAIAPYALMHDRDILNRVDDSVVRFAAGSMRVLRRARGYAPSSVALACRL